MSKRLPFADQMSLPLIAAPMFLVSFPDLVAEICKNGVAGTFPSLNARTAEDFESWLQRLNTELPEYAAANPEIKVAPYGVNLIVHKSNMRLAEDQALVKQYQSPFVITSVGHPGDVVADVHSYGGKVYHDVINMRHAQKAIEAGVDGLILVCSGAGGHAGLMNPFTFIPQIREIFDGTIILSGTLSNGGALHALEALGADMGYMGTRFIATKEAQVHQGYKDMIVSSGSKDIVYTDKVSGIKGNFMVDSLTQAGIEIEGISEAKPNFDPETKHAQKDEKKAWKEVWSAGQGVGEIKDLPTVAELVERLKKEYTAARAL